MAGRLCNTLSLRSRLGLALAVCTAGMLSAAGEPRTTGKLPDFDRDVSPILKGHCLQCHGADKQQGNLDLRSRASMLQGGDTGPALVPGSAPKSLLFERISKGEMPPKEGKKLSPDQLALMKAWIDGGAPAPETNPKSALEQDRKHWAFQKLARPTVPAVKEPSRVRMPIDAFVLAKLEEKGLGFSPDADRTTLIRRAYLDLIGLPPSPEEVQAFLKDTSPDAFPKLVDQLLASPHFGERWGRHWLDGAGYVDVMGVDNDAGTVKLAENKWLYRDYVVRCFNADKPFEQFLIEQIAGDELVDWRSAATFTPEIRELLVATGFLRTAADDTDENELNTLDIRHGVLQRTGEVMASNLLGLTLNCAKCHDHKYEPIAQRDYYRLMAIFSPAFNPASWLQPKQRALPDVSPAQKAEMERHNADIQRQVDELNKRLAELRRPYEERLFEQKLAALPEPIRADTKAAIQTPPDKRNEVQKYLASKFEAALKVKPEEVVAALSDKDKPVHADLSRQVADLNGKRRKWGTLHVVYDVGPPAPTHLLRRGNYETPGAEIPPGFVNVLCESDPATLLGAAKPQGKTSGRRLALARWLTDWDTPVGALAARVRVNRVWQQLFGRGLAPTADNLGRSGAGPTHAELLEWLSAEFVHNGRRLKPLLKLMMTSSVYQQASTVDRTNVDPDPLKVDPENQLLWRMRLRRLESEVIRDAILTASGKLDRTTGGPPIPVESRPDGSSVVKEQGLPTPTSKWRRSLYLLARRNYHPTLLNVFDQPALPTNCTCRTPSAVVLQSLAMLNDSFVVEQAGHLADRVAKSAGAASPEKQIDVAFQIVLNRKPKPQEAAWCIELLRKQIEHYQSTKVPAEQAAQKALTHLCHMLLNTNEFLYTN